MLIPAPVQGAESSAPAVIIQEIYETTRLVFRSLRSVSEERMA